MAQGEHLAVQPGDLYAVMLRRAAPWAAAAGLVCVVVVALTSGRDALIGGVLGLLIVVGFFGIDMLVLRVMRRAAPELTVFVVLVEYGVKVVGIAVLLWALNDNQTVDLHALAVTVVVTTIAWVIALTTTAMRSRSYLLDPMPKPSESRQEHGRNGP